MEPQARYVFVGTVVLLITMGLVVGVLWLSGSASSTNAHRFTIYFRKHALNGLQMNSDVTMRGIKVGSVTALHISDRNIEQVRVDLVVGADTPVKTDTVAIINRNLLTGFALIDLAKGTQDARLLQEVKPGEAYPVIPEGSSELEQLADTLPDLLDQAAQVTNRIGAVLSDENVKSIGETLANIHDVTETFAKNRTKLETALGQVERAADDLSRVSHAIGDLSAKGGKVDQAADELVSTLREVRQAAQTVNSGIGDMLRSITNTSQTVAQQLAVVSQGLAESSRAASLTLQSYEEPRTVFGGPHPSALGPGEKQ